jgi:DNA-binding FrmR family transcriptional regulator
MTEYRSHPSHGGQVPRLNRAIGQLEGIKRMFGDGQYCVEILTQLKAARSTIKTIELSVREAHIKSCVERSASEGEDAQIRQISELVSLLKKYE